MTSGAPRAVPDPARRVGTEARKTYAAKLRDGFIEKYLSGAAILDIGYQGYEKDVVPIAPQAIGVDLGYPGYDGRTLPFADNSQDAVFSSHCLEHIEDARSAIREWFRVLKNDGYLIITVPHQFLYERKLSPPSRWNLDHRRFYTTATLLIEIEDALEPNSYRVRHLIDNDLNYDYSVSPDRHSGGCYEIELVIQKIEQPSWRVHTDDSSIAHNSMNPSPPAAMSGQSAGDHQVGQLALHEFSAGRPARQRLLVLKLDHRGDLLIALPALEKLRAIFPNGHMTLVCGSWNAATARDLGIADEIRAFDYFPENSQKWDGEAVEGIERFREVCGGQFDIAVDLRVDEDTRPLLRHVDAALRCGIGSRTRHPYLNIVLPIEFDARETRPIDAGTVVLEPAAFHSRMPVRTPFFHETDFSVTDGHLIYGPYTRLPVGRLRAELVFQLSAPGLWPPRVEIVIEVVRAGEVVRGGGLDVIARKRLKRVPNKGMTLIDIEFANSDPTARYEFRVFVGGHPRRSRLRFFGVRVHLLEKQEPSARFLPAELHIGEQLSLLVHLIAERARPLYPPDLLDRMAGSADIGSPALAAARLPPSARCIAVAPLSNSTVRDWPLDRYIRLIGMLLAETDCHIVLLGSRDQVTPLSHVCHAHESEPRLINLGGRLDWSELAAVLRRADLVIANNSGVAHLAAACGRATLAIYSGSHQPQEWGPRGESVRAVTAIVPCSPCGYESLELCPHDHRCMTLIEPEAIFRHAVEMLPARPMRTESGPDLTDLTLESERKPS